jgi:hypothetical protein
MYDVCLELRSEEEVFSKPNRLDFSLTSYYTHKDGNYYIKIYHNEKQLCTENIDLYVKVYDESKMEKIKIPIKNMIKNAWKAKEQKRKDEKAKELRFFANNTGSKYNQRFNFEVVENLPKGVMYNIDQQKIHLDFDLENQSLKEKFKREALLPIFKIFEYENLEEIHGKLEDIRVSKRYYYLFKEEKIIENDCYQFYECKGTHNKKLLKVFKNGKQLKGKSRTKTLKQLGYGR